MSCKPCNTPSTIGSYNNHKVPTSQYSSTTYSNNGMSMGCYQPTQNKPKCTVHRKDYLPLIFAESCNTPAPCNTAPNCNPTGGTKIISKKREWIDDYMLNNFLFGERTVDTNLDIKTFSGIPQYLINPCPDETAPGSNGRKVGPQFCNSDGTWQAFIKVIGQSAYLYIKNCENNQTIEVAEWEWGIPDCAIKSVDADKILNWCKLFTKATIPIIEYQDSNGNFNEEMFVTSPVVLSQDCKLLTIIPKSDIRKAVVPYLDNCKGTPIWDYNPITDEKPKFIPGSLNGCVAVRVDKETVVGKNNAEADYAGTDANPLKSITFVVGHDDDEDNTGYLTGNGTKESPLDIKENSIDDSRIDICGGGLTSKAINYDGRYFAVSSNKNNPSLKVTPGITVATNTIVYQPQQTPFNINATWATAYNLQVPETGCPNKVWVATVNFTAMNPISTMRDSSNRDVAVEYYNNLFTNGGASTLDSLALTGFQVLGRTRNVKASEDPIRNYASSTGYFLNGTALIALNPGVVNINLNTSAIFPNTYTSPQTQIFDPLFGLMDSPNKWFDDKGFSVVLHGLITKP